jgi:glucose/arabinose dehydrogenase
VPAWQAEPKGKGRAFKPGDRVQRMGQVYACTEWGAGGFCTQAAFEPGSTDEHLWRDAWEERGSCTVFNAPFAGNRLTLELPGPKPPGADDTVSGTLRCGGPNPQIRTFSGAWGHPINVDELGRCEYQLFINASGKQLPRNTPVVIPMTESQGQQVTFEPVFHEPVDVDQLVLAPGIKISVFATGLRQPRQMALGKDVLYVGSSSIGVFAYENNVADFIYALPLGKDGSPIGAHLLQTRLSEPHGVAYRGGDLYYSTAGGLYRIQDVEEHLDDPHPELLMRFPGDDTRMPLPTSGVDFRTWHQKHPVFFNPNDPNDPSLYTAVGIPCNVCMVPQDDRYGSILKYDMATGESTTLARGVRNSVGLAWHPDTGEIWFSDNNRQYIDNTDEINRIKRAGEFFGVPYVFGKSTIGFTQEEFENPQTPNDPKLLPGAIMSDLAPDEIDVRRQSPPVHTTAFSSAPLGLHFWKKYPAPAGAHQLLVALHGAGTFDNPGSDVRALTVVNNTVVHEVPLITGWRPPGGPSSGRPVEFLELPDGSLLLSDDVAGIIYKVTYDPTLLPDTTLSISTPSSAPSPLLADTTPTAVLTDASGKQRQIRLGWGASPLEMKGLPSGEYALQLRDVGSWVPVQREQKFNLTPGVTKVVALEYREAVQIEADIVITAPERPANVSDANWTVQVKKAGQPGPGETLKVAWGQTYAYTVANGEYTVVYPYFPGALPEPTLDAARIDESSGDQTLAPPGYTVVPNLGRTVLEQKCTGCHQTRFWDDGALAERWDAAGVDALMKKIESMRITGHCDATCSAATANYLLEEVWGDFLDPPDPVGTRQVRLLATDEYVSAVRDVLKVELKRADVPAENTYKEFKYPAPASEGILRKDALYQYYLLARRAAQAVDLSVIGYDPENAPAFVGSIGRLLFRRPLQPEEAARYLAVLNTTDGDMEGSRLMLASMLVSPNFLYRQELGQAVSDGSGQYQLDNYEIATALSFAYLGTTPDDALLTRAANGELTTPVQISETAAQMMRSPTGQEQFARFVRYYSRTLQDTGEKNGLPSSLIASMAQEQSKAMHYLMGEGSGNVKDLFNPDYTFLNQELATHYGISGVTGTQMRRVQVQAGGQRGGLMHMGRFQTIQSGQDNTGLIGRGFRIREQFFCHVFGTPIADPGNPTFPDHGVTMRYRWDQINGKDADPSCWTCHKFVNDTGSSLENYDWTGKYRTQEFAVNPPYTSTKVDLDASLDFRNASDTGYWATNLGEARGIAELIPDNQSAMSCLADGYLRYTMGTEVTTNLIALHGQLRRELMKDGDLRRMLAEIAASSAFVRRVETAPARRHVARPYVHP